MLNSNDVNNYLNIFLDDVIQFVDSSTIVKLENFKNKNIREWLTAGLLSSVRRKQKLLLKIIKRPNNAKLVSYYRKYKN